MGFSGKLRFLGILGFIYSAALLRVLFGGFLVFGVCGCVDGFGF